mgnify:CR=1 FL=1
MIDLDDTEEFDDKLEYAILNSAKDGVLKISASTFNWLVRRLWHGHVRLPISSQELASFRIMTPSGPARLEIISDS